MERNNRAMLDTHQYSIYLCETLIKYLNEGGFMAEEIEDPRLIATIFIEHIDSFSNDTIN
jgi:hypothetical protein